MTPAELMARARQAVASARILLAAGDLNGACNRAYYAMFDAARAALASSPAPPESIRTHSGLIGAFSLHLVKSGRVPVDFGKALDKVARLRLIADYTGDEVDAETAAWAIAQADSFIKTVAGLLGG